MAQAAIAAPEPHGRPMSKDPIQTHQKNDSDSPSSGSSTDSAEARRHRGVYVVAGDTLRVANLTISLADDGTATGNASIELARNMCPVWLRIALKHLKDATCAEAELLRAHADNDELALGRALVEQANAGMQAIVASCASFDAFYASIVERVPIEPAVAAAWRKNRTGRYRCVAEILRRSFKISTDSSSRIRSILKESFQYRGWAIHPPASWRQPVLYPEIERGVEWRLFAFRAYNAKAITGTTLSILAQLGIHPKRRGHESLDDLCSATTREIRATVCDWEQAFGPIAPPNYPRGESIDQSSG